jgi:hypothetical protein
MSRKKIILFSVLLICSVILGLISSFVFPPKREEYDLVQTEKPSTLALHNTDTDHKHLPLPTAIPNVLGVNTVDMEIGGWIPGSDFQAGIDSIKASGNPLASVQYSGASVVESGEVGWGVDLTGRMKQMAALGFPVGVNVASTNFNGTANFLGSTDFKNKFYDSIKAVKSEIPSFSSVGITFEQLKLKDREPFYAFLRELRSVINPLGIQLYVVVFPVYEKDTSMFDAKFVHDYKTMGQLADKVVIMAYEYLGIQGKVTGPYSGNSPYDWVEKICAHAQATIPSEKIILGLPLYGYGFKKGTTYPYITKSYTNANIKYIMETEKLEPQYDEKYHEMYLERPNERIYFQSEETLEERKALAKKYGISQIYYWRLGRDNGIGF